MGGRVGVVFVHGFLSGPQTWDDFARRIAEDEELRFAAELRFKYASPKVSLRPWRRVPDYDDIAEGLKVYLEVEGGEFSQLVLVSHSQGGLVVQRYLARMLSDGRGHDLARISRIVLFACPNNGSEFLLSLRRRLPFASAQERRLRPLNAAVTDTQRTVLNQIVHAAEVSSSTCPIPITAYAGEADNIVLPQSARSVFPDSGGLPGDHFTIIRPDSHSHRSYTALRKILMSVRADTGLRDSRPGRRAGRGAGKAGGAGSEEGDRDAAHAGPGSAGSGPIAAYREQVRQIAPVSLHDRQEELAESHAFCASPDKPGRPAEASVPYEPVTQGVSGTPPPLGYLWWRAQAWAGKSALLSWLVLHPPTGIDIVSFFVTARFSGQRDRTAFLETVTAQLAELAGQSVPEVPGGELREAALFALYRDAATACRARGRRLVLVVDGLDEDRGVVRDGHSHSIAALLPYPLPAGMRVVVAGRTGLPLPGDVRAAHPLRDPAVVRRLSPSPHALVLKDEAERELSGLLGDVGVGRDLLGLLVAAGGGLSIPDLAELTGRPPYEITDRLRAVTGRTFASRASHYRPGDGPAGYVLAHEELQQAASEALGERLLAGHRERLHTWADSYGRRGWPADTPEYLLRGYPRVLHAYGETDRLTACALDQARQRRLLDISGGDTAALAVMHLAWQSHLAAATDPTADLDMAALVRLSVHQAHIRQRNRAIPAGLPAIWARLGQYVRAENLARALTHPAEAIGLLAVVAARAGDQERARRLVADVERMTGPFPARDRELCALAEAAGLLGDAERAESLVRRLSRSSIPPTGFLDRLVIAVTRSGAPDRAERLAELTRFESLRIRLLGVLAGEAARADDAARAARLLDAAEEHVAPCLASSRYAREEEPLILARLARDAAAAGDRGRAFRLLRRAEHSAAAALDGDSGREVFPTRRVEIAAEAVQTMAVVGADGTESMGERADRLLRRGEEIAVALGAHGYNRGMTTLAEAAHAYGDHARAKRLIGTIGDVQFRVRAWCTLARASAARADASRAAGELGEALRAAERATADEDTLQNLADTAVTCGDHTMAERLLMEIEERARAGTDTASEEKTLRELAEASAASGDPDRAQRLSSCLSKTADRTAVLAAVVRAVARAGDLARAEGIARTVVPHEHREEAFADLALAAARAGAAAHAELLARSIGTPTHQRRTLARVGVALAEAGCHGDGVRLAREAVHRTCPQEDRHLVSGAGLGALALLAPTGDSCGYAQAVEQALAIDDPRERARVLGKLAEVAAAAGVTDRTAVLLAKAEAATVVIREWLSKRDMERREHEVVVGDYSPPRIEPDERARVLSDVAASASVAGAPERSDQLFHAAEDFARRVTHRDVRQRVLGHVAVRLAEAGHPDRAEALAGDLDGVRAVTALCALAARASSSGDRCRAERLRHAALGHTQALSAPDRRFALLDLVDDLADAAGEANRRTARRLLAEALPLADWRLSLPVMTKAAPEAVGAAADEYLRLTARVPGA